MCGATSAQNQLQQEQAQFYQQGIAQSQRVNQEDASLTNLYNSILQKGPNAQGFSAGETENLNSQAVEGTAQNYAAASKALGGKLAAEGGGDIAMPTGAENQMQAELAASAAASESQQESQIQEANYRQGAEQYNNAASGAAALNNGAAYENAATGQGSAASTTANQIAQEDNSWMSAVGGAVGAGLSGWASGGFQT